MSSLSVSLYIYIYIYICMLTKKKNRFPKVSKEVLKETLNSVATRVGSKEAEKKWVCR